jgi:hypothetical protein
MKYLLIAFMLCVTMHPGGGGYTVDKGGSANA